MFNTLTSISKPLTKSNSPICKRYTKKRKKSALRRNYIEGNVIRPLGAPMIKLSSDPVSRDKNNINKNLIKFYAENKI